MVGQKFSHTSRNLIYHLGGGGGIQAFSSSHILGYFFSVFIRMRILRINSIFCPFHTSVRCFAKTVGIRQYGFLACSHFQLDIGGDGHVGRCDVSGVSTRGGGEGQGKTFRQQQERSRRDPPEGEVVEPDCCHSSRCDAGSEEIFHLLKELQNLLHTVCGLSFTLYADMTSTGVPDQSLELRMSIRHREETDKLSLLASEVL